MALLSNDGTDRYLKQDICRIGIFNEINKFDVKKPKSHVTMAKYIAIVA